MTEITQSDIKDLKADFREFLSLSLDNVLKEMSRLAGLVERNDQSIRTIELNTNTRMATMQKDIDNLYEEVEAAKKFNSIEKEEGARQAADLSLQSEIKTVKADLSTFKETQAEINTVVRTIIRLLW